jgi:hypothetical protein
MIDQPLGRRKLAAAIGAVVAAAACAVVASSAVAGTYVSGDFHNHSTCSDGSTSMQKLVEKSVGSAPANFGLDWFVQAGHGGSGNRNCTLVEDESLATPAYPVVTDTAGTVQGPGTTWQSTNPPVEVKGAVNGTAPAQRMWRWQSLQEYQYQLMEYQAAYRNKPLFLGLESVVAGHEHTSMGVITGQLPPRMDTAELPAERGYTAIGNADALAQWSYCFDRGDTDTSRGNTTVGSGVGNNWNCAVPGSLNEADVSWSDAARKLIPASGAGNGTAGHLKTVEAIKWMAAYHPRQSYYVPAHLERAGPFNPDGNNGFNIEHLRNLNNAGPGIAFGMETQPGHGASSDRGEYRPARNNIGGVLVDSVGGTTYGGTGVYGAQIGGVWDALLGEGRNFWFFASSDWHNRGAFGPDDTRSTQDFWPGEYQNNYTSVRRSDRDIGLTPQAVVNGLRSGNTFADSGQLIDRLGFVVCNADPAQRGVASVRALALRIARSNKDASPRGCATMGQKLVVKPGDDVIVAVAVRDPQGTSNSPYTFANPSLAQVGIEQPLNAPVLDHVDLIGGLVTGYKQPGSADYAGAWPNTWLANPDMSTVPAAAKNMSASVLRTFSSSSWKERGDESEYKVMSFRVDGVEASQYMRLRGTNLPASVPYETDADGNPLADIHTNFGSEIDTSTLRIPCTVTGTNVPAVDAVYTERAIDGCPSHLPVKDGQKYLAYDVAAWADLWFYSNPVFVEVDGSFIVAGVR